MAGRDRSRSGEQEGNLPRRLRPFFQVGRGPPIVYLNGATSFKVDDGGVMRTSLVIATLSFLGLSVGDAAPAPFPKPESSTEVVLDARTPDRARLALSYLRSDLFLDTMHQKEVFAQALPHQTPDDRRQWLKAHLRVRAEGTLIRIRLRDAGSLAALDAITASLTRPPKEDGTQAEHRKLLRMLREVVNNREGKEEIEARRGMWEIEDHPLRVQSPPRRLARGR
jgi:hypothetical protein